MIHLGILKKKQSFHLFYGVLVSNKEKKISIQVQKTWTMIFIQCLIATYIPEEALQKYDAFNYY